MIESNRFYCDKDVIPMRTIECDNRKCSDCIVPECLDRDDYTESFKNAFRRRYEDVHRQVSCYKTADRETEKV